jgi:hypothetical protein
MNNLHDFLTWFDGWSENIEKQPNDKQWARLCAKVAEVRKAEPVPVAVPLVPPAGWPAVAPVAPPEPVGLKKPSNEREWVAQFKAALMEDMGMDLESAGDVLSDYRKSHGIDIERDPKMSAVAASGAMN